MKRVLAACILASMFIIPVEVHAESKSDTDNLYMDPFPILTTAYCDYGVTKSGVTVRPGICAGKKEWLGLTVIAYERLDDGSIGEMLGIWECLDTGFGADSDGNGIGSIQEGKVIDMYFPTYDECEDWMKKTKGKLYIQLIDAVG